MNDKLSEVVDQFKDKVPELVKDNKGDYIKMTGGNYESATGRVIGGCDKDHDYQIELSKDQKIDVGGDGTSELVDVSGKIIDEWNYQSITKIEEKK